MQGADVDSKKFSGPGRARTPWCLVIFIKNLGTTHIISTKTEPDTDVLCTTIASLADCVVAPKLQDFPFSKKSLQMAPRCMKKTRDTRDTPVVTGCALEMLSHIDG